MTSTNQNKTVQSDQIHLTNYILNPKSLFKPTQTKPLKKTPSTIYGFQSLSILLMQISNFRPKNQYSIL